MTSFLLALVAISYLFSGLVCYGAATANKKENSKNRFTILGWIGWLLREIEQSKNQEDTSVREISLDAITLLEGESAYIPPEENGNEAGDWESYLDIQPRDRIGDILQQIAVLNRLQVQQILQEQAQTRLHFGQIAIQKGWVKPQTVNRIVGYQLQARTLQH
ncbi:hypothetical protein IQ249_04805 [Lusitaniella coriacea LEGE 07157]|uniref:Uncharacterized protein n=1 Tax=Lusitaniella coriacea LEGE 07157 TaxID=945747 RepID=A0A8J7B0W8_9CYAN|nr:hypothetical protein [Lusitaniella coriacea]MBE9115215.1 hypothetical protein [Lusitaniella coriacea LEGE 07157]